MKDVARELLKVAKELTGGSRVVWEAKDQQDDLICRVTVAFKDVGARGDDVGDVLDKISKQAADKLNTMMPDDTNYGMSQSWTTSSKGLYMEFVKIDGGGVWARENKSKWR